MINCPLFTPSHQGCDDTARMSSKFATSSLFQALCQWRIEKAGGRWVDSGTGNPPSRWGKMVTLALTYFLYFSSSCLQGSQGRRKVTRVGGLPCATCYGYPSTQVPGLTFYSFPDPSSVQPCIKVAQNNFQHIPRLKTAQSLVNTLVLFSWHNRLP